jgi:ABC-2 type transport system permease protein
MSRPVTVYFEFARIAFLKILAYRLRYFTGIITYFVNVSVYYFIWRAILGPKSMVAGYDLSQMVTYVSVGWIIRSFYFNNIDREIAAEVMDGKIALNLIKPVDTQLMYLSQTAGEASFRALMFTAPIACALALVYPIKLPVSISAGLFFLASCVLSLLVFSLLNFLIGTLALRLVSIISIIRAKYYIVEFTSGLLIPMSFFPEKVRQVLAWLPFQHISFTPLQLYLGKETGLMAWRALGIQLVWAIALFAGGRILWRISIRRLSILGG